MFRRAQAQNGDIGEVLAKARQGLNPSDFPALMGMAKGEGVAVPPAAQFKSNSIPQYLAAALYAGSVAPATNAVGIRAGHIRPENIRVRRDTPANVTTMATADPIGFAPMAAGNFTVPVIRTAEAAAPAFAPSRSLASSIPGMQMFAPGWIDSIEWRAFDEVAFLAVLGAQIDPRAGLGERLRAMHACFRPQADANKLPLDITQFDQEKIARFVAGVMGTIGYEGMPYGAGDQALPQELFKRWFLQIASPLAGNGNGGLLTAPFHGALLHLTHPSNSHRHRCSGGENSEAASPLPRSDILKQELRQRYLRSYGGLREAPARGWAFEALCQIFEPALLRKDLPDGFRYGSLAWALLSLGIDLAGDAHAGMASHLLISLGAVSAAHYLSDPGDGGQAVLSQKSMQIILTMAHAHGRIALRNTQDIRQEDVETALAFFQSQLFSEAEKLAPLEELIGKVPTRHAVAGTVLREHGIDPARLFFLPPRPDGTVSTKRVHRVLCPAEPDKCRTAAELYMRGELPQLRQRGALNRREAALPDLSGFTVRQLSARFDREFKAALASLTHEIMVPALRERIEFMDDESEEFWCCGEWTVRVPTASIVIDRGIGGVRGAVGVGRSAASTVACKAQDNVLIRLTLGKGERQRVQTYWARLAPFQLQRYRDEDKALLDRELRHFFKPAREGDALLRLNRLAELHYEDHAASGGDALLQTIAERLLEHRGALLREDAYQITAPEIFEKRLWDGVKSLLPLYSCVKAGMAGDRGAAAIHCTLDMLSMIPAISASTRLSKAILASGSRMNAANMKNVARAFMFGIVKQRSAPQSIRTMLTLGKPAVRAAKAASILIDPGFGLLHGLAKLPFQLAPAAWKRLKNAFGRHPELQPFAAQLDAAGKLALKCYPDGGIWRARQGAITERNGVRSIATGGRTYEVRAIGDTPDVLVVRDGSRFRLANPELASAASAADGDGNAAAGASWDEFNKAFSALCRVKRTGESLGACSLLRDPRFGPHGYSRQAVPPFKNYQVPLTGASLNHAPLKRLRTIDAVDLGYATQVETPSGARFNIVPDPAVRFVHRPGGVNGPQSLPQLPATIDGRIQSLPSKSGGAAIDYAVFTLSHLDSVTGVLIHTTRYVPLGTYRERDGTIVAIAYCDPSTPYSVRIDPADMPLGEGGLAITLKRAELQETEKFWRFQNVLSVDQRIACPLVADAVKLGDQTQDVKQRFEVVFERGETMLNDAIHVMEDERLKPLVLQMGAKLFGMPANDALNDALYPALNSIWGHLTKMQASLPYLKEQSPYVIGFFEGTQAAGGPVVRANAFLKSMDMNISFRDGNKPLITFDKQYFMDPLEVVNNHAATLLHEWSHALLGTSDRMAPDSADTVYAPLSKEIVDLRPLTAAASRPGSDPANHAPTVEHFLVMAAALRHEDTKHSVMSYIQSPDSHTYTRIVTDSDFNAMLGLLGDILERKKRRAV